jgi:hypothetical protein
VTESIPTGAQACGQSDADLADAAADVIMINGHHRGGIWPVPTGETLAWRPGRPVCLIGALMVAQGLFRPGYHRVDGAVTQRAAILVAVRDQIHCSNPLSWNDRAERTADEVIEALRGTAKTLRETPQQHDPTPINSGAQPS